MSHRPCDGAASRAPSATNGPDSGLQRRWSRDDGPESLWQRRWSRLWTSESNCLRQWSRDEGPESGVTPDSGPWSFSRESRRGGGAAAARGRTRAEDACAFIGARRGRRYGGGRPVRNRLVPGAGSPERFGPNRSGRTARGSAPHAVEASTRRRRVPAVSARSPSRRARGPRRTELGLLRTPPDSGASESDPSGPDPRSREPISSNRLAGRSPPSRGPPAAAPPPALPRLPGPLPGGFQCPPPRRRPRLGASTVWGHCLDNPAPGL